MTIKYKFNKSSEARDCVVESVELVEFKTKTKRNTLKSSYTTSTKSWSAYEAFLLEKNKLNNVRQQGNIELRR
jgi:hypothetical protein